MPMLKEKDFGTTPDGGRSVDYCCFCFQNGKFTSESITLEQMIVKLVEIGTEQLKMPETMARNMAETNLPKLKRWKKK